MKSLFKVAGTILAAIFAVSMFASASASAAWEQCNTEKASSAATKYSEHQCTTAEAAPNGKWAWQAASLSESTRTKGSLKLTDSKEKTEVECYGEGEGTLSKVEHVNVLGCRAIKGCEANTVSASAVDLPWKTELFESEKKKFEALEEETGDGEPGWAVTCEILKLKDTDTCKAEGVESLALSNVNSSGSLLVLATFQHLRRANCTLGGAGTGIVEGSVGTLKTNGWGLRVT